MRATPKSSSYIQLLGTSSPAAILLQSLDAASPPDRTAGTGTKWKKMAQGPVKIPQKNRSCGLRPQKPTSFCSKTPCFTCERWNVPDLCSKNTGLSTLRPGLLRRFSVQVMDFVGDTKK